jgi:hypothetical protein
MHHGTCPIWSSDKVFKSHQLKRKSANSEPNTGTASIHIPTTSQFKSLYHQAIGDWGDICPSYPQINYLLFLISMLYPKDTLPKRDNFMLTRSHSWTSNSIDNSGYFLHDNWTVSGVSYRASTEELNTSDTCRTISWTLTGRSTAQ